MSKDQLVPLGNHIQNLDGNMESLNGALQTGLPLMNTRLESAEKEMAAVLGVLKTIDARIAPLQSAAEALVASKASNKGGEGMAKMATHSVDPKSELAIANVELRKNQEALTEKIDSLHEKRTALEKKIEEMQNRLATIEHIGTTLSKPISEDIFTNQPSEPMTITPNDDRTQLPKKKSRLFNIFSRKP